MYLLKKMFYIIHTNFNDDIFMKHMNYIIVVNILKIIRKIKPRFTT